VRTLVIKNKFLITILCLFSLLFMPIQAVAKQHQEYNSVLKKDCSNETKSSLQLNCKAYHQTTNYTCGPAAVMTLMRYYGRLSPAEMNAKTELRLALEMGASEQGTDQSQIVSWLSSHGFSVDSGRRMESDTIIQNLKRGTPTLLGVNHHWILAKGFEKGATADEDQILFADSCCNTTIMSRANIDAMWQESMLSGNRCTGNVGEYIVATPN